MLEVMNGNAVIDAKACAKIVEFERQLKQIKAEEDKLKAALIEEMEKNGLLKVENDDIAITYVAATDRETFDGKKFKADNPDLYDEYVRMTPVKASVRIKVK